MSRLAAGSVLLGFRIGSTWTVPILAEMPLNQGRRAKLRYYPKPMRRQEFLH